MPFELWFTTYHVLWYILTHDWPLWVGCAVKKKANLTLINGGGGGGQGDDGGGGGGEPPGIGNMRVRNNEPSE